MDKQVSLVIVLAAAFAAVSAAPAPQFYYSQPAIASTSSNVLRTPGNLGQISTYTKAIDTPTSSVRKSDVRISNDALAYPAAVTAYHAPAAVAYHAPAAVAYHAPVAAAPAAVAYHAPVAAAPVAYHAPVATASHSLLGVAYSSAPAVAHFTFDGFGTQVHY